MTDKQANAVELRNSQVSSGAVFSEDRQYRYQLWRTWAEGPRVLFVMLNPSIADETADDPTQRRCRAFAQRWGFGGYYVGNLYALVSTDPKGLSKVADPVGRRNGESLRGMHLKAEKTVVAWGCQSREVHKRAASVLTWLGNVEAIDTCKDGCPRHPLYLRGDLQPRPYSTPEVAA